MRILSVQSLADHAVTLHLAREPGLAATRLVGSAARAIAQAMADGLLPGAEEVAPAFTSLTVTYDCLTVPQADLVTRLGAILAAAPEASAGAGRLWHLPCAYGEGIDLSDLSVALGLSEEEIISRHSQCEFHVLALGFLPGLPFLGDLPAELARPRRPSPRQRVPKGAVAIANRMGVIYPWESPGGWHIVGTCPVALFDPARAEPALLATGDRVRFVPVPGDEARAMAATPPEPLDFLVRD